MNRNFYTVKEVADLLNTTESQTEKACQRSGVEKLAGVYLIGYWQLANIKTALSELAGGADAK